MTARGRQSRPGFRTVGTALALATLLALPAAVHGQEAPPASGGQPTEWMAIGGAAVAQSIFNSVSDRTVVTTAFSHGWFLRGTAADRGRPAGVEAIIEIVPTLVVRQRETVWGFGVTPIFFRWNFDTGSDVTPFTELAGGYLFTGAPVPEGTSRALFTAHVGAGVRLRVGARTALVVGYRLHHISNGETADPNPGLNSHMGYVGVSVFRR